MNYEDFFMKEVPLKIKELQEETQPAWGSMTAPEMLDHLRKSVDMSMKTEELPVNTPPEKIQAYHDFLMSDKPFSKGRPKPEAYDKIESYNGTLEERKVRLMRALVEMQVFFNRNKDHTAVHPTFGKLTVEEWKQFHYKHFVHHFTQFHLMPGQ